MEKLKGITDDYARSLYNLENNIVFDPLLYIQRYKAVINCLDHPVFKKKIRRIVEFGCSEMKFFVHMKNALCDRALKIDQVDIEKETIIRFMESNLQPLITEFVKKRAHSLIVNAWCGNIKDPNPNFENADAVVAIELIEHVYPDVFEEIPFQIFGKIQPKIVVLTTPNCEFNKLFNLKPGEFRHDDHKFEFNREQFNDYCQNLCVRFPNYFLQIEGIGTPPPEIEEDIGHCSQLALFVRKDFYESLKISDENESNDEELITKETILSNHHELIAQIEYPFYRDDRSRCEKIISEVEFHVNRFKYMGDEYANYDMNRYEIPLNMIARCCWEITGDEEEIAKSIEDKFTIENGLIILPLDDDEDDFNSCDND